MALASHTEPPVAVLSAKSNHAPEALVRYPSATCLTPVLERRAVKATDVGV
jgi:hypothetical protein